VVVGDSQCGQAGFADVVENELAREVDAQAVADIRRGRPDVVDFQGDGPVEASGVERLIDEGTVSVAARTVDERQSGELGYVDYPAAELAPVQPCLFDGAS
jgi:hypothetical protein